MTTNEIFDKNLVLNTEFSRYVLEHPEIAHRIPINAIVVILPEFDRTLAKENLKIAKANQGKEQPMVLIRVKKLAPERKSRLIRPTVEIVD